MQRTNPILTTANQPLPTEVMMADAVTNAPVKQNTLDGVPLGTSDNSSTGELGAKVVMVGNRTPSSIPGFDIPPYDEIDLAMWGATNNLKTVTYKLATVTVATLNLTYVGGGAADNDVLLKVTKS